MNQSITQNNEQINVNQFCEKFNMFLCEKISLDKIIIIFNSMDINNQIKYAKNIVENNDDINLKYFEFVYSVMKNNDDLYCQNKTLNAEFQIKYYFHIINNKLTNKYKKLLGEENILIQIYNLFNDLEENKQKEIMNNIIFEDNKYIATDSNIIFIKLFYDKSGGFEKYNFTQNFNKFIQTCTENQFNNMYNIMSFYSKPNSIPQINYSNILNNDEQIVKFINIYLIDFEKMINDPKYVLYNKLQILKLFFDNIQYNKQHLYHKEIRLKGLTIIEKRILNNPEYQKIEKQFYDNLFSKTIIPYSDPNEFVFLSKLELLY
jgi:hypothetical protein